MPGSIRTTIKREFFPARGKTHAKIVFYEFEVAVVMPEEYCGIGAFSKLELFHKKVSGR
ncbi:hypothetical protein W02_21100 [Nitrospira sp. KM1]|nr:hypothetical protein W02_21100 [Nitrospira sp. KM1]